jgi:hypothetical protein
MPKRKAKPATTKKRKKKQITPVSHPIWKQARRSAAKSPGPVEGHVLVDGTLFGTGFIQEPDRRTRIFHLER